MLINYTQLVSSPLSAALATKSMALSVHSESQNGNGEVEDIDTFNRFDVVSDDSDHFFLNPDPKTGHAPREYFANASTGVHKTIMKEWRILQQHLPETIVVRVYEKRIDLLRAAIIGAPGTPYHDGLFFFDLEFPNDYPASPPYVHYRSFGLRVNPNLYATGKVCLSLINTWVGKKIEKWNPNATTVLQLLVSIQALVLNEKPFYNEPFNGIFPKTFKEKKSLEYNEQVFVNSCRTMLYQLRKPPKNFEEFVIRHFRERGSSILLACTNYVEERVKIGYFNNGGSSETSGFENSSSGTGSFKVSKQFLISMKQLHPQLVAAFSKAGASLGNSIKQLNVEVEEEENKQKKKKKPTSFKMKQLVTEVRVRKARRFARRVFGKLKNAFRLKLGRNGLSKQVKGN